MTEGPPAVQRAGTGAGRLVRMWRALPYERRLAALASSGLFLTLFLPWYQETVVTTGKKTSASITGWGAFSFVEAAVLLIASAVLTLLFQRAEGRAFHLPGGDGWVIMAGGVWTCVLVVWRIFDKQSVSVHAPGAAISGVEWGIFVALAGAAFLAYAGSRIRVVHQPEPPLPGDEEPWAEPARGGTRPPDRPTRRRPRQPAADDPPIRPARPASSARAIGDVPEPHEPPTMRLGDARRRARAGRPDERAPRPEGGTTPPQEPAPRPEKRPSRRPDEQLTIPLEDLDERH